MTITALLAGAGQGDRLQLGPKAFLRLHGETLLQRAVRVFSAVADQVVAAVPPELVGEGLRQVGGRAEVIAGGETRDVTVRRLLARAEGEVVLVHDVARAFTRTATIGRLVDACRIHGAAVMAWPLSVGAACGEGGVLDRFVSRSAGFEPQGTVAVRRDLLDRAYQRCEEAGLATHGTGELLIRGGVFPRAVRGDATNIKITTQLDWEIACRVIADPEAQGIEPRAFD